MSATKGAGAKPGTLLVGPASRESLTQSAATPAPEQTKRCTKCGETKTVNRFYANGWCNSCNIADVRARHARSRARGKCQTHPGVDAAPGTCLCLDCHVYHIVYKREHEAKAMGLPFELDVDWVRARLPHGCPCCGCQFVFGRNNPRSPSVDKFYPKLGYPKSNAWLICRRCNQAKSNHTPEEAMRLALWMRRVMEVQRTLTMKQWVAYSDELQAEVDATIARVTRKYRRTDANS